MINRRNFLTGIIAAAAAPAIIRTPGLIMPIKPPPLAASVTPLLVRADAWLNIIGTLSDTIYIEAHGHPGIIIVTV